MTADNISETNVWQLVQAVSESEKYAFLIGAGTSKPEPAGIPTGGGLIETWQEECHKKANTDTELEKWVAEREKQEMDYDQSQYGFWFEKRHPTRGERRHRIDKLVREADPTPGHITLASLMSEGYVPHVITPNFDDLLFDAFYLFLEDKPNLIDHRAVAPEFKLTRDDPTIVKVHGDYLYDNLQNTDTETEALEPAMEDALQQTATEYGLIVVGYSGTDDSIMDPLLDADLSEYGIYWCVRDTDDVSAKVGELLEQPNTHLVEIGGFVSLMEAFYDSINEVELPERTELVDRAMARADLLEGTLEESAESTREDGDAAFERALDKMAAQRAVEKNRHRHAIELLDEVIDDQPDVAAYVNRGNSKSELGRHEESIKDYNRAIEINSEDSKSYYNRGNTKLELEQYEEAIEDYDKAIELDSEPTQALVNRGNAKSNLERHEEAIEDYSKAIKQNSEDSDAYYNRGYARFNLEKYEDALEDFTQAIELDPEYIDSYYNRANVLANLERYEEALEDLSRAIELNPEDSGAYADRGTIKSNLERHKEALEDLDRAIELNPEDSGAYADRGAIKSRLERYEEALEDLDRAIELNLEDSRAYANRGLIKSNLERHEEALEDLDRAIELDPESEFALRNRSEIHLLRGDFEEAQRDAKEARSHSTSTGQEAVSRLLELIAKITQGDEVEAEEEEYRNTCEKEFTVDWDFKELDGWLEEEPHIDDYEKIEELIDMLRKHRKDNDHSATEI
ncbi:tetratricopeptide repeat protein [Halorubrum sp. AS12]|uniref:tetratricopeptide repeat protein n=1 Tax=Halorubrum sp. AS12 TaxID=3409687 RepID=UPI003DA7A6FD